MKYRSLVTTRKLKIVVGIILVILILLELTNNHGLTRTVISWGASLLIAMLITAFIQSLINGFAGKKIENIFLHVEIRGRKFSMSLFFIMTLIVKFIVFPLVIY